METALCIVYKDPQCMNATTRRPADTLNVTHTVSEDNININVLDNRERLLRYCITYLYIYDIKRN